MTITFFTTQKYHQYLSEIENLVLPKFLNIVEDLKKFDIQNHYICQTLDSITEYEARGFVWSLFMNEVKNTKL